MYLAGPPDLCIKNVKLDYFDRFYLLSSAEGRLPLQVVFHHMLSSTEGRLPPKVIFHCILDGIHQAKLSYRINFSPFNTSMVVGLLVSAYSVKINWAQVELGKNKSFWESSF